MTSTTLATLTKRFLIIAVPAFLVVLAAIATERVHRTKVALVGGAVVVVVGSNFARKAIASIDFNTVGLLTGTMLLVHITGRLTGDAAHARPRERGPDDPLHRAVTTVVVLSTLEALRVPGSRRSMRQEDAT